MTKVTCSFCGLPFSVRKAEPGANYFCCSGCALASRIPLGEGGSFPVSAGLVVALTFGFGLFNQLLFAALGFAVAGEGRPEVGNRLLMVSVAIGGAVIASGLAFILMSKGRRWADGLMSAAIFAAVSWLGWHASRVGMSSIVWLLFGANIATALWLARGWLRRAASIRRRRKQSGLQV